MQDNSSRTVPCRYCPDGRVSFFAWFKDPRTGVIHYAATYGKKVFAPCSNPQCPGRRGDQYTLPLAA